MFQVIHKRGEIMTDNLQIELLKQQLNTLVVSSKLPEGVINLVLQTFAKEYSDLYIRKVEAEYQEYQQSLKEEKKKEDDI